MIYDDILNLLKSRDDMRILEIQEELGKSKSLIWHYLDKLVKLGKVEKINRRYRWKSDDTLHTVLIPYWGEAKAGSNDKFINEADMQEVPVDERKIHYRPENLMLVNVSGTSMTPTFDDGDLLLFKRFQAGEMPRNNDVILCNYEAGVKIKRFITAFDKDGMHGLLISDNKSDPENVAIRVDDTNFSPIAKFVSKI